MSERGFEEYAAGWFADCLEILCQKRIERGTANIEKQGLTGIIQRMQGDKLERVRIWARRQQMREELREYMPQDLIDQYVPLQIGPMGPGDTIEDDLLDVANYALIAVLLMHNQWDAPVNPKNAKDLVSRLRMLANSPAKMTVQELIAERGITEYEREQEPVR